MNTLNEYILKLTAAAIVALLVQGCAAKGPPDPARAAKDQTGQTALEGMENSVLKDNNPDTAVRAKPPN
jgi:hypothetical protein